MFFGKKGLHVRPMKFGDLQAALRIIEEHDEDDAAEAEDALIERNCAGMLILENNGEVVGITGAVEDDGSPDIRWLSWTYVRSDMRGQGAGNFMVEDLLKRLNDVGVRKIFIATSDYMEDGEDVYADARKFYEELGAREELRVPDYHDTGETKIIFGLENPAYTAPEPDYETAGGLAFEGIGEASESKDGYGLIWSEGDSGVVGLDAQLADARQRGARAVFAELPDDLSVLAETDLEAAGFRKVGALKDYYGAGADQIHWSMIVS